MAKAATKAKRAHAKKAKAETAVVAYKAFHADLSCNGFQYEVGKTFTLDGKPELCNRGFHACENPLDVLNYYDLCGSRFARVTVSGEIDRQAGGGKLCAASITIDAELSFPDWLAAGIKWIASACKVDDKAEVTSGHYAKNASSGHSAKNASSGHYATNASSGHYAKNASSGDYATNASSGDYAKNASSGDYAKNASSGHSAKNASSGDSGSNEASGEHAVICGAGRDTRYKGAKGVWISAAEYTRIDGNWRCIGFATGQAGYGDVPADTWLIARDGKLVECGA